MDQFVTNLSIAGGVGTVIVVMIIVLTLFFKGLFWITGDDKKPESIWVRGFLTKQTLATVHLADGKTFERVRFIGFTRWEAAKPGVPYDLNEMIILEDEQKQRFFVRSKNIQMIVVSPTADSASGPDGLASGSRSKQGN